LDSYLILRLNLFPVRGVTLDWCLPRPRMHETFSVSSLYIYPLVSSWRALVGMCFPTARFGMPIPPKTV